jgi:hypothetical protein
MAAEISPCWQKSSYSMGNGNCVETTPLADGSIAVRDSKHPDEAILRFTPSEWKAFVAGVKDSEFDHLAR